VHLHVRGEEPSAACPGCGEASERVHSHDERMVSDAAISNQQGVLHLRVRRFFCDDADCAKKTFAEQIPGLTFGHGRATVVLQRIREDIALALGGSRSAAMVWASIGVQRSFRPFPVQRTCAPVSRWRSRRASWASSEARRPVRSAVRRRSPGGRSRVLRSGTVKGDGRPAAGTDQSGPRC
jgi:transposase